MALPPTLPHPTSYTMRCEHADWLNRTDSCRSPPPPPHHLPAKANFTLMTECMPETSGCYSVYSVVLTLGNRPKNISTFWAQMTVASLAAISGPNPLPFALVFDSLLYCRLAEGRLKAEEAFREAVANERKKADEQFQKVSTRDTREGWPLLSVQWVQYTWKGSVPGCSLGLSCQYKRLLSFLGCSIRPSSKYIFSSPYTISLHLFPWPGKLGPGSRAASPVSLNLSLVSTPPPPHNDISR